MSAPEELPAEILDVIREIVDFYAISRVMAGELVMRQLDPVKLMIAGGRDVSDVAREVMRAEGRE